MAIRTRKPTSAGRRFQSVSDFAEITKSTPEKSLLAPRSGTGGRNSEGHKTARHRGGGHKRQYRLVDFKRTKDGVRRQGRGGRVRPQPHLPHRPAPLRGRREGLHPRPPQREGRRPADERPGRRHPARQRPAPALHPGRHRGPQRRAAARPGRQDGPLGRLQRPAGGQGGRLRLPPPPQHRDAPRARSTAGRRSARSATPSTSSSRSARPAATGGRACAPRPAAWP